MKPPKKRRGLVSIWLSAEVRDEATRLGVTPSALIRRAWRIYRKRPKAAR